MSIKDSFRLIWKIFQRGIPALFLLPLYWIASYMPRDKNLWIFTSWSALYNDNPRLFFEWINQNHSEIKTVWISDSKHVVRRIQNEKREAFYVYSPKVIFMLMRAGKLFTSTGSSCRALMKGADWYDLWHGMPLKQIGHSTVEWRQKAYPGAKTERLIRAVSVKVFPWRGRYSQKSHRTIVNSPFFIPILMDAFGLSAEDVLKTGSPRCDALFSNRSDPFLVNLRIMFPNCKIILYMPTFRGLKERDDIFDPFIEKYGFNEAEFEKALEWNNCVLIYKAHAKDLRRKVNLRVARSRLLEISDEDYDELYNFVGQVDVLATDYSSIYFDFLATKKPVILCPFDLEDYKKHSRPLFFDYENIEGVKARNWHEFIRILDEKSYYPVSEETRIKFAEYLDGNCCQKVFDAVMACDKASMGTQSTC